MVTYIPWNHGITLEFEDGSGMSSAGFASHVTSSTGVSDTAVGAI